MPKNYFSNINALRRAYLVILFALLAMIVSTPHLIRGRVFFFDEEIAESIIIFFLLAVSFIIYSFYQNELRRQEQQLNELIRHIGSVNLQVGQIKAIFSGIQKYPENKKDFKNILTSFADKVLSAVNCEWVSFRIIELSSGKTLTEYAQSRGKDVRPQNHISNKMLIENAVNSGLVAVPSKPDNFNIKVFCVFPSSGISENQISMLQTIADTISMLYIIFTSKFYGDIQKNNSDIN
jgi:hypothetical protein